MFPAVDAVMVKMPAPITTETPKTIRSHQVRSLRSRVSGSSVSAIDCSTDLVRQPAICLSSALPFRDAARASSSPPRVPTTIGAMGRSGEHAVVIGASIAGDVRRQGAVGLLRPGHGVRARRTARRAGQPFGGAAGPTRTPVDGPRRAEFDALSRPARRHGRRGCAETGEPARLHPLRRRRSRSRHNTDAPATSSRRTCRADPTWNGRSAPGERDRQRGRRARQGRRAELSMPRGNG